MYVLVQVRSRALVLLRLRRWQPLCSGGGDDRFVLAAVTTASLIGGGDNRFVYVSLAAVTTASLCFRSVHRGRYDVAAIQAVVVQSITHARRA